MKKGISVGIIALFIVTAVSPMVIGFNFKEERQVSVLEGPSNELWSGTENTCYGYCLNDPSGQLIEGPVTFCLDDPGNISQLWGTSSPSPMTGGKWAMWDGWYCCEYGSGDLWMIEGDSGYMIEIGGGGVHLNGLTQREEDRYGSSNTSLYLIDKETGEQTLIGSFGLPEGRRMGGIAWDPNGALYGVECVDNDLYCIDLEIGEAIDIGPLGIEINGTADLDIQWEGDCELYLSTFTSQGELYTVDKKTGECTLVGEFQGGAEISAFTIPYDFNPYLPTANFSWSPQNPQPGETIIFNASSSYDSGYITLYEWDWDNDLIFDENSTNPITSHMWDKKGFYPVTLLVHDDDNCMDAQRYVVPVGNQEPEPPIITGPTHGKVNVEYDYNFSLSDPDNDSTYLRVDWGNGTSGPWQGSYASDITVKLNHTWNQKGKYTIRAQTKDVYGMESDWAYLEVTMPKNKPFNFNLPLISWLLDRFPILQKILDVLRSNIR